MKFKRFILHVLCKFVQEMLSHNDTQLANNPESCESDLVLSTPNRSITTKLVNDFIVPYFGITHSLSKAIG